jgi:hypothetical protein
MKRSTALVVVLALATAGIAAWGVTATKRVVPQTHRRLAVAMVYFVFSALFGVLLTKMRASEDSTNAQLSAAVVVFVMLGCVWATPFLAGTPELFVVSVLALTFAAGVLGFVGAGSGLMGGLAAAWSWTASWYLTYDALKTQLTRNAGKEEASTTEYEYVQVSTFEGNPECPDLDSASRIIIRGKDQDQDQDQGPKYDVVGGRCSGDGDGDGGDGGGDDRGVH